MSEDKKSKDLQNKEDPAQLSKRKKLLDNMKGSTQKQPKKPKFEWTQSSVDVTMSMKIEGIKQDQLKKIDVQFTDTDVTIKLPDGRNWTWYFSDEIFRENSRVKIKKQKITLHMKKKKEQEWPSLENECDNSAAPGSPVPSEDVITDPDCEEPAMEKGSEETIDTKLPPDDIPDEQEAETEVHVATVEDPVVELQHIKHDYIEKDDTFCVHIYVKQVNKDNLTVTFEENSFNVNFYTSDPWFLRLHEGCTEDTKFSWKVNLRGSTVKEKCSYKLTSNRIDLSLAKEVFKRWGDLEALKRKETLLSKAESWTPINKVTANTDSTLSGPSVGMSDKQVRFDEMKTTIERDNLADKASIMDQTRQPQKPTCKVQPLNKPTDRKEQMVTPGYTGLDNLGNTCFMNGVLQCLINTREFRDFFLDGEFQRDLNTDNVLGSGGKLAVAFAVLMKVMWSGHHYSYATSKLKNLVAQKASQFTGFAQHDSQEFLAFLLDGLHEDLNRIRTKPYTETVEDRGRPDEVVANEAWAIHKKRNNSFVVDLFQGQYKSKLVCPVCGKVSITFDPFLYLSLPLPKRQRLLPVTFMWKDPHKKPVRYMLRLSKEAAVEALKDGLYRKTGIQPANIRVFEAYKGRINKIFGRGTSLSNVQANDSIIACEVLSEDIAGEPVYEVAIVQRTLIPNQFPSRCHMCKKLCPDGAKLKRCTKCLKVGYCDQTCQKNHWTLHKGLCKATPDPVGMPFIISLPESRATFSRLCQLMEAYARFSVDVFQPPVKPDPPPQMTSQSSSSNLSNSSLSNSSQSSGSLNSLDSQSSFSSTCTITAEQEQSMEDTELINEQDLDNKTLSKLDDYSIDSFSNLTGTGVGPSAPLDSNKIRSDLENKANLGRDIGRVDSGYASLADKGAVLEKERGVMSGSDKEVGPNVKHVIGIQSGDTERTTPTFFIKPVNSEGVGLTGADGERIDDKGDIPLDLKNQFFLSVDWRNSDKLQGYVLVQSKDMEFDNDSSMMTANLEESNSSSLQQCMELFTEPEVLSSEEAWYCPECKEHREATKQLSTWKLPHTLIIQLKRFSFRNFIWRDKIDKMVDFPTRGLDLSAYYVGSGPSDEPPPIYDLYGVVNHHGGILGGHYTSFVRCADRLHSNKSEVDWRLCDDSRVSSISHEKNVVTRAAYLLFYRRRKVFVPSPTDNNALSDPEPPEMFANNQNDNDEDDDDDFKSVTSDNGDSSESGELIIDTTPPDEELELPDLEEEDNKSMSYQELERVVGDTSSMKCDEGLELGYTDMDSVD